MDNDLTTYLMAKDAPLPFVLPEWISLAPYEKHLSMQIVEHGKGKALLTMPFYASHCQGQGLMHGGAIVSLADTALAIAIKTLLPEGSAFVTTDMSLQFHAPVRWGTVTAKARVVDQIERDIKGEVEVITEEGVTAATFRANFRVRRQ